MEARLTSIIDGLADYIAEETTEPWPPPPSPSEPHPGLNVRLTEGVGVEIAWISAGREILALPPIPWSEIAG